MSDQQAETTAHPLTLEQWRAAMEWCDAHPDHVLRLMASKNGLDSPNASYPPSGSDKAHPELWKAPHWRWLAEDEGP